MTTCGIFGFEFTRPFEADGLTFQPLYTHPAEAKKHAHDEHAHHLTGTVSGANLQLGQVTYRLAAVLSFIERLDVRLSEPIDDPTAATEPRAHFEEVMRNGRRPTGGGAVINPDTFPPHRDARQTFIKLAMGHLADDEFCERTKFRLLLIKAAETCRQRSPFLEVSYFLLMSGLEAFSREVQNDRDSPAAAPIARMLAGYGFKISENNPKNLPRAISTYLHIRNAIFHNGELSKTVRLGSDTSFTVNGEDYLIHLQALVCLTVMKVIGFEDLERNWDGWFDYQRPHGNLGQADPAEFLAALREDSSSP